MIKHFCDVCANEITDGTSDTIVGDATLRTVTSRRKIDLSVSITIKPTGDDPIPELCTPCAFAAVIQLSPEKLVVDEEGL